MCVLFAPAAHTRKKSETMTMLAFILEVRNRSFKRHTHIVAELFTSALADTTSCLQAMGKTA